MKFCSYLNGDSVKCKYFNKRKKNCNCQYFLDPFFFDVVNNLTCKTINIGNFSIKLYYKRNIKNISKFIRGISIDSSLNGIAKEKYENEVITKRIEEIIQNTAFVVCLVYRSKEKTYLIKANDCYRQDNYEENIRPTNVLPYYYNEEYRGLDLLGKYSPLKPNSFSFTKGKAAHIVSVLWNKNGNFNQLLNLHILNKWTEDTKISAYFSDSLVNKINCELFTLHGINQTQLENNSIAKSFLELGEKDYTILLQLQDTQLHATRAAISQVMARNMSHNIGSHVISKYKDKDKIPNFIGNNQYIPLGKYQDKDNDEEIYPLFIANFNEYLKDRMDFLADIASTDPVIESSLNFVCDILRRFDQNPILLNRISGVESDVKYSLKVRRYVDGSWQEIISKGDGYKGSAVVRDFPVSIPNDILGTQAWYIFLENIIRNIYKHANPKKEFTICIDFKEAESDNSLYEISVYDTLCKSEAEVNNKVKSRNIEIDKKVLSENKLRDGGLGTIEMKVCAAFIRKLRILSIEDDIFQINKENGNSIISELGETTNELNPSNTILCAYKHKLNKKEWPQNCKNNSEECSSSNCYTLGYKFFVSKPKEVLVVTSNPSDFKITENGIVIQLLDNGILVKNPDEIKDNIFPYQFLYILDDGIDIEVKKPQLPKRVVNSDKKDKIITNEGKQGFISSLWKAYFRNSLKNHFNSGNKSIIIHITDTKYVINIESITHEQPSKSIDNFDDAYGIYLFDHTLGYNEREKEKAEYKYHDISWSASLMYKYINQNLDEITAFGYLECVKQKIVVIDERIQQNIVKENRKVEDVTLYEFYNDINIIIPNCGKEDVDTCPVDLNADKLDEAQIKDFIDKHTDADYFVMHLGLIERLIDGEKTKLEVSNRINLLFNSQRHKLILTSGRGSPPTVPDDICYLPISVLQYAIETVRDKFYLTRALFNSRKIQDYGNK